MYLVGTRPPAVAGMFYDGRPEPLRAEVEGYLRPARERRAALGVLVPHAGYRYSGAMCGRALAAVEVPQRVLILHSKHHPGGGALSLACFAHWRTPLGEVRADLQLTESLTNVAGITASNAPHHREHAAEVVVPFLQVLRPSVSLSVVSVGGVGMPALRRLAGPIASVLDAHTPVLMVASSDMNHYQDQATTLRKDERALAALEQLDAEALLEVCEHDGISMCGSHAAALMLLVALARGAAHAELLEHDTSAATSGAYDRTVGYATARVW